MIQCQVGLSTGWLAGWLVLLTWRLITLVHFLLIVVVAVVVVNTKSWAKSRHHQRLQAGACPHLRATEISLSANLETFIMIT